MNDTVEEVMIGMELGLGHHGGSLHPHNMPQHQMHSQGLMHQTQQQMHHDDGKNKSKTDQNSQGSNILTFDLSAEHNLLYLFHS